MVEVGQASTVGSTNGRSSSDIGLSTGSLGGVGLGTGQLGAAGEGTTWLLRPALRMPATLSFPDGEIRKHRPRYSLSTKGTNYKESSLSRRLQITFGRELHLEGNTTFDAAG